jgi:hypothetical protein
MVQVVQAKDVTMIELVEAFKLRETHDSQFFGEWQVGLPELTAAERQGMDEVKANYSHLTQYPVLEPVVKMAILSPLLGWAGFYRSPFYIAAEMQAEILSEDEGVLVQGQINILVFEPPLWVVLIAAKQIAYSVEPAIPQLLTCMMSHPNPEKPAFGIVSNGAEFCFLKLVKDETPVYARSDLFLLDSRTDRYVILQILKHLGQIVGRSQV